MHSTVFQKLEAQLIETASPEIRVEAARIGAKSLRGHGWVPSRVRNAIPAGFYCGGPHPPPETITHRNIRIVSAAAMTEVAHTRTIASGLSRFGDAVRIDARLVRQLVIGRFACRRGSKFNGLSRPDTGSCRDWINLTGQIPFGYSS